MHICARARARQRSNPGVHLNIIAGVSSTGELFFTVNGENSDAAVFLAFLLNDVLPRIVGQNRVLILDNVRFHLGINITMAPDTISATRGDGGEMLMALPVLLARGPDRDRDQSRVPNLSRRRVMPWSCPPLQSWKSCERSARTSLSFPIAKISWRRSKTIKS